MPKSSNVTTVVADNSNWLFSCAALTSNVTSFSMPLTVNVPLILKSTVWPAGHSAGTASNDVAVNVACGFVAMSKKSACFTCSSR
ncbi:hypothetical protein D1872_327890 [compost metagenome]